MNNNQQYLQSIAAQETSTPVAPKKKWIAGMLVAFVAVITMIVVAVVLAVPKNNGEDEEEPIQPLTADEKIAIKNVYDDMGIEETLNEEYAAAVKGTKYADYESDVEKSTKYAGKSSKDVCSLYYQYCPEGFKKLDEDKKVSVLNSKSLDYYLDNDYIVVMVAKYKVGKEEVEQGPYTTIIYGRSNSWVYSVFDADNTEMTIDMSRVQLFNDVAGVPTFYAIK